MREKGLRAADLELAHYRDRVGLPVVEPLPALEDVQQGRERKRTKFTRHMRKRVREATAKAPTTDGVDGMEGAPKIFNASTGSEKVMAAWVAVNQRVFVHPVYGNPWEGLLRRGWGF